MDESPCQLIGKVASTLIMHGQEARLDYEYIRHGMVNLFMANEPLKGKRLVEITQYKTKKTFQIYEANSLKKCTHRQKI